MVKKDSKGKQEEVKIKQNDVKFEKPVEVPKKEVQQNKNQGNKTDLKSINLKVIEPKILAFVCNWCGYGAVESTGVAKNQYPANIEIVRVMCAGRVERKMIIDAIEEGIKGVLIVSCNFGNCHYMDGNTLAQQRIEATKRYLSAMGYNKERIRYIQIRASEGNIFAKELSNFVEKIKEIKD